MPTRPYRTADQTDALLRPYLEDMQAGMSDAEVSRKTGIGIRGVQRWRAQQEMKRPRSSAAKQAADIYAISTFGEALGDVKQRTASSAVGGLWEPPVFLTREHIDYTLFLRVLDAGSRLAGLSEAELVKGLGISGRGIEQGLQILAARQQHAPKCMVCADPTLNDKFCSALCARLARKGPL